MCAVFNEGIPSSIAAVDEDTAAGRATIMTVYLDHVDVFMARRTKRHNNEC
jgi:hypothetical protein